MKPKIYCIMIIGKRYNFVNIGINNFVVQTYPNKHLLIINHGDTSISNQLQSLTNATEVMGPSHFTLGELRNFAISLVPINALHTTFDDDDWRHPKFLEMLYDELRKNRADVVFFRNRLDVNLTNGFVYRCKFENGTPHPLTKNIPLIKYLNKKTLEDIDLYDQYKRHNKRIHVVNNNPKWYIRTIHDSNTSSFVVNSKRTTVHYAVESSYHEFDATGDEISYAKKIVHINYKDVVPV